MNNSQMLEVLEGAGLSPEKAGKLLGVSGMTVRRWRRSPRTEVAPLYENAFEAAVQRLVADGQLDPDAPGVRGIMAKSGTVSFQATLKSLGISGDIMKAPGSSSDRLMLGLSQIASDSGRVRQVDENKKKIWSFGRMGDEWKRRIEGLWSVIRSARLTALDKLVAYGALFYLLTPFDLIPDTIPVFGLLDDYAVLGLALAYYMKRFPDLFPSKGANQDRGAS